MVCFRKEHAMAYYQKDPADFTPDDVRDPLLDAGTLYRLAEQRPDLWPYILRHPQVYSDLADYIQQGNPDFPPPPPPGGTQSYGVPPASTHDYQPYDTSPGLDVQPPLTPSEEKTWGVVMPLGAIIIGFISPLLVWLIFRERSRLIDLQGRHALNWTISYAIYWIGGWILTSILIGYLIMAALIIFDLVVLIIAAVKASDRQAWRYPLAIQFFNTTGR